MASHIDGRDDRVMNEQNMTEPRTGLDRIFDGLRGIGIQRRTDDKWIGGVCSGLADRLGIDPVIVRAALVLLAILGGVGVSFYLVAWGFPWGLAVTGLLIWWLVRRSRNRPDADQRVSQGSGMPPAATNPPVAYAPPPGGYAPPPGGFGTAPAAQRPEPPQTFVPRKPRRRSGGPLMALLAIGLALVTYGSLSWLGDDLGWTGGHHTIALAGSLAAMGLLLVWLGLAGWRAGFVGFLAIVLAITAWSSTVVPSGIRLGGRVGDVTWAPTSISPDTSYNIGVGSGVLDLSGLPAEGLSQAQLPAYVGLGELKVIVPADLTVEVKGHVGLGEIVLPGDTRDNAQGGTDMSRSMVIGEGPTEVVLDAGVGIGSLTVVKE